MKKLGRRHRPFYRVCAVDSRAPRDGKVLEELGTYDPMVPDTDARAVLRSERIDFWISRGAQPSDKVKVLIKKYGTAGTHLEQQRAALERLAVPRAVPEPGEASYKPPSDEQSPDEPAAQTPPETPAAEAPPADTPPAEAPAAEEATSQETADPPEAPVGDEAAPES
jgi:small subunit ribosomal protein S16